MPSLRNDLPMEFGDADTRRAYELRCDRARAAQTVPFAVAPLMTVKTCDGRILTEGQAVQHSDFEPIAQRRDEEHGSPVVIGAQSPTDQLTSLIRRGVVLALGHYDPTTA